MITLRRTRNRRRKRQARGDVPQPHQTDALSSRFGSLEFLEEDLLAPGGEVLRPTVSGADIVSYVVEGTLAYDDALGHAGVLHAGEFRRLTTGRDTRLVESNPSTRDVARVFHVYFRPSPALAALGCETKRFSRAEREGLSRLVASPDARDGSLRLRQDALVFSGVLERGCHTVHQFAPGQVGWVHVVEGSLTLERVILSAGDGAGISHQPTVSLTAQDNSEVLLIAAAPPSERAVDSGDDDGARHQRYR